MDIRPERYRLCVWIIATVNYTIFELEDWKTEAVHKCRVPSRRSLLKRHAPRRLTTDVCFKIGLSCQEAYINQTSLSEFCLILDIFDVHTCTAYVNYSEREIVISNIISAKNNLRARERYSNSSLTADAYRDRMRAARFLRRSASIFVTWHMTVHHYCALYYCVGGRHRIYEKYLFQIYS